MMGGHGDGSLFSGASGGNGASSSGKSIQSTVYHETPELRDHIEHARDGGRSGIVGGHEKSSFEDCLDDMGGRVEERSPSADIDGVETVVYRLPRKDGAGNPTEEFQAITHSKTIYDSSKISTDDYIERGLEAANDAANRSSSGRAGREWSGEDSHGVKWHGYTNDDGTIATFYPEN